MGIPILALLTTCLISRLIEAASISRHVQLGDHEYFLPPQAAWSFSGWHQSLLNSSDELIPLTVVHLNNSTPDPEHIQTTLEKYRKTDDVWTPEFTEVLYLQSSSKNDLKTENLEKSSGSKGSVHIIFSSSGKVAANKTVPPGPYFVHQYSGNVYQAYKLYPDTNQAFLQPSYQDPDGVHHNLRVAAEAAGGLTVAVPSRLYFMPSKSKPLAGLRIAVKDLYDLRGMKTSGGNRALFEMSKSTNSTAVAVQKLIDAGAVIVGKNKLSEFAFAGPFVTEHIDFLLPFNPRGDGYNSPGDSSGGSAASVASYDWLDVSMGSDTGGSIRGPATQNGIFGNRPSHGAVNMTGVLVLSNSIDTSGIFSRDPKVWSRVNKVLYSAFAKEYTRFPRKIYVNAQDIQFGKSPTQSIGPGAGKLFDRLTNFTGDLASLVHGNITSLSLDGLWSSTNHHDALANTTLYDVTGNIYGNLTRYEQWTAFGKDYLSNYQQRHNGRLPYMTNSTLNGWQVANSSMTPATHREDIRQKRQLADWASRNLFKEDRNTCSDSIFLYFSYPNSAYSYKPDVSADTNNLYISQLTQHQSILQTQVTKLNTTLSCNCTELSNKQACSDLITPSTQDQSTTAQTSYLASLADLPDYAVTLGSIVLPGLVSSATGQPESLPYGVNIVSRHGCDFMVQNLITALHEKGVIRSVKAGSLVHWS